MTIVLAVLFGWTLGNWIDRMRWGVYKDEREVMIGTMITVIICGVTAAGIVLLKGI